MSIFLRKRFVFQIYLPVLLTSSVHSFIYRNYVSYLHISLSFAAGSAQSAAAANHIYNGEARACNSTSLIAMLICEDVQVSICIVRRSYHDDR